MAYGCGGSSPPFRTILKGNNDAKLLFPFAFSDLETFFVGFLGIPPVYPYRLFCTWWDEATPSVPAGDHPK